MTVLDAALWGFLGSAVAEALTLSALMRPTGRRRTWRWPWAAKQDRGTVLFAVCLRLFAGGGLATPLGVSQQIATEFGLFVCGAAAPLIVARLFQLIPLADPSDSAADGGQLIKVDAIGSTELQK
ncbi:hypothetical protein [Spongiactinospora sp. TRM90649]|uniref:hypothetical protein n=1 Tax=Spongiactinospora sp. TRM90649 TaxID=3031114 RepID=UPI0023F9A234|nr:hypothetical protein [Spongiactinospora sp. TRM90649]MDF5753013.1 hypothetical protein [Spongiactinospora sp. TRM90649]